MNRKINGLVNRLWAPSAQATLIFVAGYTFLWGLWLLIFNVFQASKLYSWLDTIMPEEAYGFVAIAVAIAMASTVFKGKYPWTAYGAMAGFSFWGMIGTGYLIGDYRSTGAVTAFGLSLYSAFVYLSIRLNRSGRV